MFMNEIREKCDAYKKFIYDYMSKTNNSKGAVDICKRIIRDSKNNAITDRAAIVSILINSTIGSSVISLAPTYVCAADFKRCKKMLSKGKKIQLPVYGDDGSILSWIRI